MSEISSLDELYADELKDLWSANDQMAKVLKKIAPSATNAKLKTLLSDSQAGIAKHTEVLKTLIEGLHEKVKKEHCKGMQGLVAEATKHTIDDAPTKGAVLDAAIIAQFQRMTHYGITGFGTVSAFAKALKRKNDSKALDSAVKDMIRGDELMSELAEAAINVQAAE
ncbi:ferritin-like domain-containing protein [Variovorax sp. GT1P44]|uniref:YciE/YciF ferroxidase family protein n=1 Tax=Variovorax sp. GT1P44 TaxID=3443742 RepID=UPI003F474C1F